MSSWMWLVVGVALVMLELLVPSGFFLLILGGSSIVVGILVSAGLFATWIPQAIAFCGVAVVSWLTLGKKLQGSMAAKGPQQGQLVGARVKLAQTIPPGGSGTGELWGTSWRVVNIDTADLVVGGEAVVVDSEGITLKVKRAQ